MKIEIIELLNLVRYKKAPKNIIYGYCEYEFVERSNDYKNRDDFYLFPYLFNSEVEPLNKVVEIIEEKPKKIEEIGVNEKDICIDSIHFYRGDDLELFQKISNKINELIKSVNYLLEKDKENE